jgi:hypothetical protein
MVSLLASLVALVALVGASAFAQSRCEVAEKKIGEDESIAIVNEAGWYVVERLRNTEQSYTLKGPGGYSRHLPDVNDYDSKDGSKTKMYLSAVGLDGSVYFINNIGKNVDKQWVLLGISINKLSSQSKKPIEIYSLRFNTDTTLAYQAELNSRGQLVVLHTTSSGKQNTLTTAYRFSDGRGSQQVVNLPQLTSSRRLEVANRLLMGTDGKYLVYQLLNRRTLRGKSSRPTAVSTTISGLCLGNVTSQELSCVSPSVLENLNSKRFRVEQLVGNHAILMRERPKTGAPEYLKLAFDGSLPAEPRAVGLESKYVGAAHTANGDANFLSVNGSFEQKEATIVQRKADGSRAHFLCRFEQPFDLDMRTNPAVLTYPLQDGGMLLFGSHNGQRKILKLTLK